MRRTCVWLAISFLLTACGGSQAAPTPATSSAPVSAAPASKLAASAKAAASKPAASSAAAKPASSGAKDKLTIAYTAPTLSQLGPAVAKEQGFFDQNGLDVDVVPIGAGSQPQAALMSNQLQLELGGPEVVAASVAGADLEFVGAEETVFLFWLYGSPKVKTAADLKGGKVAVTSLTSSTYTGARYAVQSLKLDPDKDVTFIATNNPAAILAAMESGQVEAGMVGPTNKVQVESSGKYHMLVDLASIGLQFPAGWWAVSKGWAASHDAIMQRLMKSMVQAVAYIIQQPEGTQKILAKVTKNDDPAFLKGNYDTEGPHIQKVPYADVKGVQMVLDGLVSHNAAAKTANAASIVDNHWLKALEDSGYIASLYK